MPIVNPKSYSRPGVNHRNYSQSLRPTDRSRRFEREDQITASGISVNLNEVMKVDTVLACVRVLAESMAALPFELLQEDDKSGSTEPAYDNPIYELMRWQPNEETTAYEFRLQLMVDALIRGTGYAQVRRTASGKIIDLWQLQARHMKVYRAPKSAGARRPAGRIIYCYTPAATEGSKKPASVLLESDEVLRIQVLPNGGLIACSLVELQRESIGASKASEQYASEFFANGGVVSGIVEVPEEMSEETYLRLKKDWETAHSAKGKRHGVPILEGGAKFNPIALNHEETQLLETRKFQRSTLAGIFRCPAHMINDLEKATFSNIEHQDLNFVKHTLRPWMTNWEQRCRLTLLTPAERKTLEFRHDDRDLLRGDFPTRMEGYSTGVMAGIFSPNDVRRAERMNTYPGGDDYFVNGTLVKVKDVGKVPPKDVSTIPDRPRRRD